MENDDTPDDEVNLCSWFYGDYARFVDDVAPRVAAAAECLREAIGEFGIRDTEAARAKFKAAIRMRCELAKMLP